MKKLTNVFYTCLFFAMASSMMFAQNADYRSVLGVHAGYSLTGAIITSASDAIDGLGEDDLNVSGTPALQVTFDYGLTDWLSVGVAGAFQTFSFKADDYTFFDDAGMSITENASARSTRMSFALRTLFHYGNKGDLDLYSGLRLQRVQWSSSVDSADPNFGLGDDLDGGRFGIGIVPFGLRYYFTEMIGAGFEIMWGAPYVASLNVNARF